MRHVATKLGKVVHYGIGNGLVVELRYNVDDVPLTFRIKEDEGCSFGVESAEALAELLLGFVKEARERGRNV